VEVQDILEDEMVFEINYYYGAIFLACGLVMMMAKNQYFNGGMVLAVIGFGVCAYSYKQMEKKTKK